MDQALRFYVANFGDAPQLSTSTPSVSTLSSSSAASNDNPIKKKSRPETTKKRNLLESWVEKPMAKTEFEVFKTRLIEMVADCNLPFAWIEQKSTKRFFAACRTTILNHVPSRKRLSGPILRKAATASVDVILRKVIFLLALCISAEKN